MSSLVVKVRSHLFPQFAQLNREIGTTRGHWGDGEFAAVNCGWAGTAPGSYMSGSRVNRDGLGNPSEARWRRQLRTDNSDSQ